MMPLSCGGVGAARLLVAGVLSVTCGTLVFAQKPKADQKPDPAAAAQQQAQDQEVTAVVHAADAAMSGQAAAADFPIQVQTDFLKAQAGRVWVPLTLTLDPAKSQPGPMTLYLRVTPRGMTAPVPAAPAPEPAASAKDPKKKNDKNSKDAKSAPAAPPPAA